MYFIVFLIAFFATFITKEISTNILYLSRFILVGFFMISIAIDERFSNQKDKNNDVANNDVAEDDLQP